MYRAAVEGLLGFRVAGGYLDLDPCIPRGWPGFAIAFAHASTRYRITVENPQGLCRGVVAATLDGAPLVPGAPIALVDDGADHQLRVTLGA
jgi:cyclic beta-1,2-glucan synthetase